MIDFKEIRKDGEDWEAFARDFLSDLGFTIEVPPDRGADGGRDLLVVEQLKGKMESYPFRWLVSCKHFALSGKSVSPSDEQNILDRVQGFGADGFLGFYSTLPSSGLNQSLDKLRSNRQIRDYKILDGRLIENYLVQVGYGHLLMRYLPNSYRKTKPLHQVIGKYLPLECFHCGIDLLEELNKKQYSAIVGMMQEWDETRKLFVIHDFYWSCKGECDRQAKLKLGQSNTRQSRWEDISDLVMPTWYLKWILVSMNQLKNGHVEYTDKAFEKEKHFVIAMAQKVMREMTAKERGRVAHLQEIPDHV